MSKVKNDQILELSKRYHVKETYQFENNNPTEIFEIDNPEHYKPSKKSVAHQFLTSFVITIGKTEYFSHRFETSPRTFIADTVYNKNDIDSNELKKKLKKNTAYNDLYDVDDHIYDIKEGLKRTNRDNFVILKNKITFYINSNDRVKNKDGQIIHQENSSDKSNAPEIEINNLEGKIKNKETKHFIEYECYKKNSFSTKRRELSDTSLKKLIIPNDAYSFRTFKVKTLDIKMNGELMHFSSLELDKSEKTFVCKKSNLLSVPKSKRMFNSAYQIKVGDKAIDVFQNKVINHDGKTLLENGSLNKIAKEIGKKL